MAVSIPKLDVYYIEFVEKKKKNNNKIAEIISGLSGVAAVTAFAPITRPLALNLISLLGFSLSPEIIKDLKHIIDKNRFYIIKSKEELEKFDNAYGNEWVTNSKALKSKQYYIRHPKKTNRNLLIEAKDFYDYVEEEQKDELIDFIMSHCSAKRIMIERREITSTSGKSKANIKGADIRAEVDFDRLEGNYFNFFNPAGTEKTEPRENYLWIDKSVMRSISALTEGSSITQTYENDMTFGLSIGEAKTIGLDLNKRKKYVYMIHIEC